MDQKNQPIVYLVGAGPGDPGLITVKGARLLESADCVVYDYLSNPQLLSYCRPDVEAIYVGKKAAAHTLTQAEINQLLVDKAKQGKTVVRLKGGDPFVFGRGGEECETLVQAGIPFEVVPGITSAIGGPAYAGIPVTHRDFNSSFTFITGHEKEEEYQDAEAKNRPAAKSSSDIDWSVIARLPCIAFYMGVKALPRICSRLVENGMDPATPAAVIQWSTTPRQRTVVATVKDLPEKVVEANITAPAMTIIGKVVSLRQTMNWFETRPMFGQTVVVTRTREQASGLSKQLGALGANVIEAPTIELTPATSMGSVDKALKSMNSYDWVVFTSANGVEQARDRLRALGLDARAFGSAKIAGIGEATVQAIYDLLCLNVDICPEQFVGEALAEALINSNEAKGRRFLLLRADIARPILREKLQQAGAQVDDVAIYETRTAKSLPEPMLDALEKKQVQWVTFTSSSTAKNLATLLGSSYREKLAGVKIASIGPITSATLKELGLTPTLEAETFNVDGLVRAMVSR